VVLVQLTQKPKQKKDVKKIMSGIIWNVKRELEKLDKPIQTENHQHNCPYCNYLNRQHKYYPKGNYTKCENCERIFLNRSRKSSGRNRG